MVVGLGNPGKRYLRTRHNIGFMVVDRRAAQCGGKWQLVKSWRAEVASQDGIVLVKPQTFMNESGISVARAARHHRIRPDQLLVILDDVALRFGQLRMKAAGSAGGHNGLRDILAAMGTSEVPRLRVGIAPAEPVAGDLSDFVLGEFSGGERSELDKVLGRATQAVAHVLENGVESAMNSFNKRTKDSAEIDPQEI